MKFRLKFKEIDEERELPNENYTVKDLLKDLGLSSQNVVSKANGELVIEEYNIKDNDEIQIVQIIYGG